jgi:IclR family acetate operon transcriptional repressor
VAAPDYQVQSLARAVALLQTFSVERPTQTIGEMSRRTALPRSTVHRLVVNLVRLGLLARDPVNDRYRLGLMLARLGNVALSRRHVGTVARPVMERLVHLSGESSMMATLDGRVAVYTDKVESERHRLSINNRIGDLVPMHCTGTGKCLLAFMNPDEVLRVLKVSGLPRRTARTLTDLPALLHDLAEIRSRGYSIDRGESEEGLTSIAAPIWDAAGTLVGTVCVAGPSERILAESHDKLAALVRAAGAEISRGLGADPVGEPAWGKSGTAVEGQDAADPVGTPARAEPAADEERSA